jgi:hypothetical protein
MMGDIYRQHEGSLYGLEKVFQTLSKSLPIFHCAKARKDPVVSYQEETPAKAGAQDR